MSLAVMLIMVQAKEATLADGEMTMAAPMVLMMAEWELEESSLVNERFP
jgi:hypothetical protein